VNVKTEVRTVTAGGSSLTVVDVMLNDSLVYQIVFTDNGDSEYPSVDVAVLDTTNEVCLDENTFTLEDEQSA
jgi:hypothetical protein